MNDCVSRITNYLASGGLFNPELMDHEKVSTLLQDSRDRIKELENDIFELEEKLGLEIYLAKARAVSGPSHRPGQD